MTTGQTEKEKRIHKKIAKKNKLRWLIKQKKLEVENVDDHNEIERLLSEIGDHQIELESIE